MIEPANHPRSVSSSLKFLWLNIWFWTVAPLFTLIVACLAFSLLWLFQQIFRKPRTTHWLIRRTISYYGAGIIRCPWPLVTVAYVDLAPHETGPAVFVANHRSASDAFLMSVLPLEAIQMLNIWPSKIPPLGLIARLAGYLKVREMPFDDFIGEGTELLQEGCSVVAFPEGTRSGSAVMGQFHGSAFRLAQANGVKIIPMAISGNEHMPPRGSAWLYPGKVVVSKLPAVLPESHVGMNPYKLKTMVRDMIGKHLETHSA